MILGLLGAGGGGGDGVGAEVVGRFDGHAESVLFLMIDVGIGLIALAVVMCLIRVMRGPNLVDRGIASDTVAVQVAALVLLVTIRAESLVAFDAVLIVSILGFVSTLAFAQYIGRRGSVEVSA